MAYQVYIDSFSETDHLRGKRLTYAAVKDAVLAAGRFSVFEATETPQRARIFDRLCKDPEIETDNVSCAYPWTLVRRKVAR
jgi:hypothetical protein